MACTFFSGSLSGRQDAADMKRKKEEALLLQGFRKASYCSTKTIGMV